MLQRSTLSCCWFLVLAGSALAQRWFDAVELIDPQVVNVAVGDLNGDGRVDIVRVTTGPPPLSLSLHLQTPDGFFPSAAAFAVPGAVARAVVGDLDGDGNQDLVLGSTSGVIAALGNGAGSFSAVFTHSLEGEVKQLLIGDVDADGRDDVAVLCADPGLAGGQHRLRWLVSTPPAGFTSAGSVVVPRTASWHDLVNVFDDSDPIPDLALYDSTGVLRLFAADGAGNLSPLPSVSVMSAPYANVPPAVNTDRGGIAAGDLDGDGDIDVVVGSADRIQVVRRLGVGWSAETPLLVTTWIGALALADADGDGDLDVFSRSWTSITLLEPDDVRISLLVNDGAGLFTLAWSHPIRRTSNGSVFAVDLDGDGLDDLVGSGEILHGDGDVLPPWPAGVSSGDTVLDVDGDGDLDGIMQGYVGYIENRGATTFSGRVASVPSLSGFLLTPIASVGDFNGDGWTDLLVSVQNPPAQPFGNPTFARMAVLLGQPDGSFADSGAASPGAQIGGGGTTIHPAADIDGDGALDVPAPDGLWRNDGSGFFTPLNANLPAPISDVLDVGDVDGDLKADLLVSAGGSLRVYRNVGPGTQSQTLIASFPFAGQNAATFGDVDLDGRLDVVAATTQGVQLFLNDGTGAFSPVSLPPVVFGSGTGFLGVAIADVDGDALPDLVASRHGTLRPTTLHVLRQSPAGTFTARVFSTPTDTFVTGAADLDADGDAEILGQRVLVNQRHRPPTGGRYRQIGEGDPGGLGARPLLGVTGLFRSGETFTLSLTRVPGGSGGLLALGLGTSTLPDYPFPGQTVYAAPFLVFDTFVTTGLPGVPATGTFSATRTVPAGLAGISVTYQCAVADALSPFGLTVSNAIELTLGL